MDLPINPHINTQLEDNSKTDESFTQQGNTVNIGQGAVYNQNCGNQKHEFTRVASTCVMLVTLIIGFMLSFFYLNYIFIKFKNESAKTHNIMQDEYHNLVKQAADAHDEILQKSKEGTIWLLRYDIIKAIDLYNQTKIITKKQFKCLKDEFEYYKSIGGNHDVEERYDDFVYKVLGTGEIKMINANQLNQLNQNKLVK